VKVNNQYDPYSLPYLKQKVIKSPLVKV